MQDLLIMLLPLRTDQMIQRAQIQPGLNEFVLINIIKTFKSKNEQIIIRFFC